MDSHVLEETLELERAAAEALIAVEPDHEAAGEFGADVGHFNLVADAGLFPVVQSFSDAEDAGKEPDVFAVVVADQAEDQGAVEVVAAGAGLIR